MKGDRGRSDPMVGPQAVRELVVCVVFSGTRKPYQTKRNIGRTVTEDGRGAIGFGTGTWVNSPLGPSRGPGPRTRSTLRRVKSRMRLRNMVNLHRVKSVYPPQIRRYSSLHLVNSSRQGQSKNADAVFAHVNSPRVVKSGSCPRPDQISVRALLWSRPQCLVTSQPSVIRIV